MFNFRDTQGASGKSMESLSEELQHFNNQRKLVELDLEKRLLSLEDILKDLKKSLGSLDSVQELKDFLANIEYVRLKLRDLEDLSLIDKLEGVEVKEKLSDALVEQDEMKQKLDLVVQALKNLDPNEGDMKKTLATIKELEAKVDQTDSLLKDLQAATLKTTDMEPVVAKIDELDTSREILKNDLQRLVTTLREQLEVHDKRIVALQQQLMQEVNISSLKEQLSVHEKELELLRDHNRKLLMLVESRTSRHELPKVTAPEQPSEGQEKLKEKLVQYEKDIADVRRDVKAMRDALESRPAAPQMDMAPFLRRDDSRVKQWDATLQKVAALTQQLDEENRKGLTELHQSQIKLLLQNELSKVLGQVYAYSDKVKESLELYKVSISKEIDDIHLKMTSLDPKEKLETFAKKVESLESTLKQYGDKLHGVDSTSSEAATHLQEKARSLETKLASLETKVDQRLDKLTPEALESVKETVNHELSDVLENLTQISTSLREENDQLKEDVRRSIAVLQENLAKHIAYNDVSHVESKLEKLESKLKNYQYETNQQSVSQIESLRKRLIDAESDIGKLRVSIPAVSKGEIDELHEKLHDVESKSSTLFENLDKLHAAIQKGVADLNRNIYAKVSSESQALKKEMEYMKEQIDEIQNTMLSLEHEPVPSSPQSSLDASAMQTVQSLVAMQKSHEEALHALQMKHDREIAELRTLIAQKPVSYSQGPQDADISKRVEYLQRENSVLRKELEKVRDALLHIMQRDTEHPTIIE